MSRSNFLSLTGLPGEEGHQELSISTFSKTPGQLKMLAIVGSEGQPFPPVFVAAGEHLKAVAFQAF